MDIWSSNKIIFNKVKFINNFGWDNLINVINSDFLMLECLFMNISTFSANVIFIIYSNFTMNSSKISLFYPNFIYGSFSKIILNNNAFNENIDSKGSFKVGAIFLLQNITFTITKSNFSCLKSITFGSVKKYKLL